MAVNGIQLAFLIFTLAAQNFFRLFEKRPASAEEAQEYTGRKALLGKPYRLPCYRNLSEDPDVYKLVPPEAHGVSYRWQITDFSQPTPTRINENSQMRINPKTGDLYFAYLTMHDQANQANNKEYSCWATLPDSTETQLNRLYLSIDANPGLPTEKEVLFPTGDAPKVICAEKTECKVICIFGGVKAENSSLEVIEPVGSSAVITIEPYGFRFTSAAKENSGTWQCRLIEYKTCKTLMEVSIQVQVLALPKLRTRETFRDTFITTNSSVEFRCDVEDIEETDKIEFYINGALVTTSKPSYVSYSISTPNLLRIPYVQRNHSSSIMCVATNAAGSMYETVSLDVYDSPVFSRYPDAHIAEDPNVTLFEFNCSFKLDSKTSPDSVKLYWSTNRTASPNTKITAINSNGIHAIVIQPYNSLDSTIESRLTLQLSVTTIVELTNTIWWCTVEYKLLGTKEFKVSTAPSKMDVKTKNDQSSLDHFIWPYTYIVVGVMFGFILLVVVIVLMRFCVKEQKGEQYYVDEKERKAGHIPEQELEAYAFQDYKRRDQNPIEGSHSCINLSDSSMDSEQGSIDEYGDIETGRFDEYGSFIGRYRPNHSRNIYDFYNSDI